MTRLIELNTKPVWLLAAESCSLIAVFVAAFYALIYRLHALSTSKSTGRIRLPTSDRAPLTRGEAFNRQLLGNVPNLPDDDGEHVNTMVFWRKVLPLRITFLLLVLISTTLQGFQQLRRAGDASTFSDWLTISLTTSVFIIQPILAFVYALTKDVSTHSSLTYHNFTLASLGFLHIYLITLGQYLINNTQVTLEGPQYALFALSFMQIIAIGSVPCEPGTHFDLKKVYNRAVAKAIDKGEAAMAKATSGIEGEEPQDDVNMVPEYSATIISRLILVWVVPIISKMSRLDQADIQDLPGLHHFLRTQNTAREAMSYARYKISPERWGTTCAFLWEVWVPQWRAVLPGVGIGIWLVPCWYIPHYALQQVLTSIELGYDRRTAMAWAVMLVLGKLANMLILLMRLAYTSSYASPRIRAHTQYLLYRKLLSRNIFAKAESIGKAKGKGKPGPASRADILNLISVDVSAIAQLGFDISDLFRSQLELVLGATYVWMLLGPSGLIGLSTLLATSVPACLITKLQYKVFEKRLAASDTKVSLMQEAVQAISMIKMMAAERYWYTRIKDVRDVEFDRLVQARLLGFLSAVFEELRPVLTGIPQSIAECLQQILSAKRIGAFIRTRDVDYHGQPLDHVSEHVAENPLFIRGKITWDISSGSNLESVDLGAPANPQQFFKLDDIDVVFPRGQVTLIAGKVGAGKTLMLLALLGEAHLIEGDISYAVSEIKSPLVEQSVSPGSWDLIPSGVAYVPQTAWLQSQSIRENILFGLPLDMDRYRAVIFACALLPDLEILDDADLTEIGERGKILSGGQKARVSLARAVYSLAATVLLDDVISAVDAQTSQHIIQHCFIGSLMKGRTVIIASHAVESLAPLADQAIFLDAGRVVWTGPGPELLSSEHMSHLNTDHAGQTAHTVKEFKEKLPDQAQINEIGGDVSKFEIKEAPAKTPKQLIMEEKREKGKVNLGLWRDLFTFNGGKLFWLLSTILLLIRGIAPIAERRVLELWTADGSDPQASAKNAAFWVILYSAISGGNILLSTTYGLYRFFGGLRAMKKVHAEMLENMLRAKMVFFSRTRTGSIIQRFGSDLSNILSCSELIGGIAASVIGAVLAFVSVTYYGGWPFAGVTIAIFAALYKPSIWYRSAGRQIRRLQSVTPGLVNAIYGETIAGTAVIRAFGMQSVFLSELMGTLNVQINMFTWRHYIGRWLYINLRLMDLVLMSTMLFIILTSTHISASSAGFILAFVGSISANANWLMIHLANFETDGVSLERTAEYRHLELEGGHELVDGLGSAEDEVRQAELSAEYADWPSAGKLEVRDLSAKYGPEMPEILHNLNFSVEGGQRVGIVGATGGGKSTLAKALFRFVDITGQIIIDERDTAHMDLGQVRCKLSIIAQDPILISGTLRLNLDIESVYTDDQLYDALHQVQLVRQSPKPSMALLPAAEETGSGAAEIVAGSPTSSAATVVGEPEGYANIFSNLDFEIKFGGENLSAGQKQLVVLARALLKRSKILILDEATASIDSATDGEISRVVHEEFTGATVLIIAHRLRTIMPCSKILVMDKGSLIQQGSPLELIRQEGKFQQLCMAGGADEYRHLVALAEMEAKEGQLIDIDV